jgi:molybdopterin-guanine dinucleotide biosynthesis protein B
MIPVVSFVGYSNSGKTTFLVRLVSEMKARGYRVAVVKHDRHGFDIDIPGKDTYQYGEAGADIVCISSPQRFAYIEKRQQELPLEAVLERIKHVDIIFTEGYKREQQHKIEVFRHAAGQPPIGPSLELIAVVSDKPLYEQVCHFAFEQTGLLADFLERRYLLNMSDNN